MPQSLELGLPASAWRVTLLTAALAAVFFTLPLQGIEPVVLIGIGALPALIVLSMRRPFIMCLIFIALSYFRIPEAYPVLLPLRAPFYTGILALFGLAWHVLVLKTIDPNLPAELKWFSAFFVAATLSMIFALNRDVAYELWSSTFIKIAAMVFAIAWLARKPEDFGAAAQIVLVSGILISLVAIYNKLYGIGLVEGTRVTIGLDLKSSIGDPNDLALVLLFPLAFAVALVLYWPSAVSGLLATVTIPLVLLAIVFTQSRGGLIGVLAVFGLIGLRVVKSKVMLACIGGLAALALVAAMGISGRESGGASEIAAAGIDESANFRLHAWMAAVRMALARPLTGVGLDNFQDIFFYYTKFWVWQGKVKAVHSTWFGVLAETGFPGIILFLGLIVATFISCLRSLRTLTAIGAPPMVRAMALALLAGLTSFCAAGTFLTQGFSWPIYILIALVAAVGTYTRRLTRPVEAAGSILSPATARSVA